MKTKKTVTAVLTAALLIFALLVSSCMDLATEKSDNDAEDNYQVPPGKGLVKFKISDESRTIFPTINVANMHFAFIFKSTDNDQGKNRTYPADGTTTTQLTNGAATFTLDEGTYLVTINAYKSSGVSSANLITGKEEQNGGSGYVVVTGTPCSISTALTGLTDGSKEGLFTYNITLPNVPTNTNTANGTFNKRAHTLDVFPYPYVGDGSDASALDSPINLITSSSDAAGIPLDSGFYVIKVVCEADYCQDVVVTETMHVYNNLTTNYTKTVPNFKQNKFTVKFDMNGVSVTNAATLFPDKVILNAGLVPVPEVSAGVPRIPSDSTSNNVFVKWVTASGGSTAWDFANRKIYTDNVIIFAEWTPAAGKGSVTVNVSFPTPASVATLGAKIYDSTPDEKQTLTFDDFDDGYTIVITLAGANPSSVWTLGSGTDVTSDVVSGTTLTIRSTTSWLDKLTLGQNIIYVNGSDAVGGFSAAVIITISPKS